MTYISPTMPTLIFFSLLRGIEAKSSRISLYTFFVLRNILLPFRKILHSLLCHLSSIFFDSPLFIS